MKSYWENYTCVVIILYVNRMASGSVLSPVTYVVIINSISNLKHFSYTVSKQSICLIKRTI